jgi:hypothetical protein
MSAPSKGADARHLAKIRKFYEECADGLWRRPEDPLGAKYGSYETKEAALAQEMVLRDVRTTKKAVRAASVPATARGKSKAPSASVPSKRLRQMVSETGAATPSHLGSEAAAVQPKATMPVEAHRDESAAEAYDVRSAVQLLAKPKGNKYQKNMK